MAGSMAGSMAGGIPGGDLVSSLLGSSMLLDYNANDYSVGSWPNAASVGTLDLSQGTPGAQPAAGTIGEYAVADFTPNDFLSGSGSAYSPANAFLTVFAIARFDSLAANRCIIDLSTGSLNTGLYLHYYQPAASMRCSAFTVAGAIDARAAFSDTSALHLIRCTMTSAGGVVSIDGVDGTPNALSNVGTEFALTSAHAGVLAGTSLWFMDGGVARIIVANNVSAGVIAEVDAALMADYGL